MLKICSLISVWCRMVKLYPNVSKMAIRILLPFPSTYLCEYGFSTLVLIKTKHRNQLSVEDDVRCAISKTEPDIKTYYVETISTFSLINVEKYLLNMFSLFN